MLLAFVRHRLLLLVFAAMFGLVDYSVVPLVVSLVGSYCGTNAIGLAVGILLGVALLRCWAWQLVWVRANEPNRQPLRHIIVASICSFCLLSAASPVRSSPHVLIGLLLPADAWWIERGMQRARL